MPDGKTYVVVNSSPAPTAIAQPAPQQHHHHPQTVQQSATTPTTAASGHWVLSSRPSTGLNLATAGQPMQPVNVTNISGLINGFSPTTTFVLGGTGGHQVLQLQVTIGSLDCLSGIGNVVMKTNTIKQDGTLLQTTAPDQSANLLTTNYGGLFIRCPPQQQQHAQQPPSIFSPTTTTTVRTLQPVPIAPGRSPGRSPDSSSVLLDGTTNSVGLVTSSSTGELIACGEATPPSQQQQQAIVVRTAHPSPVVQSSQIDSCVQEVDDSRSTAVVVTTATDPTKPMEHNNNIHQQHWLKPGSNNNNNNNNNPVPVTVPQQIPIR